MLPLHASRPVEARRGSIALTLKRRTAARHREAEAIVLATGLFTSRAAYVRYLARLHGFYAALEPALARFLPELDARRKQPALEADLACLGMDRGAIAALPRATALPRIVSEAAALGVGYVLEGKTLGARFLLAEAQARLGLDAARGALFLAGYGPRTAAMWTAYRQRLEAFVGGAGRRMAVVAAAEATFASFSRWVKPLGNVRSTD